MLTKEIESWEGFAASLRAKEDCTVFIKTLTDCHNYAKEINAKGQPFPESSIMALLFSQHKIIEWLASKKLEYKRLDNDAGSFLENFFQPLLGHKKTFKPTQ